MVQAQQPISQSSDFESSTAFAQMRLMGARSPWYLMADGQEGKAKEAELNNKHASTTESYNNISLDFVYEHVPHITFKSIAHNTEIDVLYDKRQKGIEPIRAE